MASMMDEETAGVVTTSSSLDNGRLRADHCERHVAVIPGHRHLPTIAACERLAVCSYRMVLAPTAATANDTCAEIAHIVLRSFSNHAQELDRRPCLGLLTV